MFELTKLVAGFLLAIIVAGCASQIPTTPAAEINSVTQDASDDSLGTVTYDDIFFEIYGSVIKELGLKEKEESQNAKLVEARSIIRIAEEIYLEGNPFLAIKLLNEAELLLRQVP